MSSELEPIIQTEKSRRDLREAQIRLDKEGQALEGTEGWKKLSDRQQYIVKHSLYISARAIRTSDPKSAAAVRFPRKGQEHLNPAVQHERHIDESLDPLGRRFRKSQNLVANWYCHAAIWALENERSLEEVTPELDIIEESFYDGKYFIPETVQTAFDSIKNTGFPVVVHIAQKPPPLTVLQAHTFLALGIGEDGDIIGWEKQAEQLPFQPTTLSKVYKEYSLRLPQKTKYYWGVRRLRTPSP